MTPFLGPLNRAGHIPAPQQTRVAAFLISAHAALTRQLAATLPGALHDAWQLELHVQFSREIEILSLLARATSWVPDPLIAFLIWQWEAAWWPKPARGIADLGQALLVDLAAFAHALYAGLRPAALLPEDVSPTDPFSLAMRHIELENGRLMQGQILFLKGPQFLSVRDAVAAAVEQRHDQLRRLWSAMLNGIGVDISGRHLVETTFQAALRDDAGYQASLRGGNSR